MKTVLYNEHIKLDAKIIDYYGWMLPINYGSQIDEHLAVRNNCGIFDVSHMAVIDLHGENTQKYLLRMLSNDISKLAPKKAMYSCMLNPHGGVIDDLIVYMFDTNHYRIISNASTKKTNLKWLNKYAEEYNIKLYSRDELSILALQGPDSFELLSSIQHKYDINITNLSNFSFVNSNQIMVAKTGYTGESGYEIILNSELVESMWVDLIQLGIQPCGLGARDSLRLEAGFNLYGSDMNQEVTPLECGLGWTLSKNVSQDYIGRNSIKLQSENGVFKKQIGVILNEKVILRPGQTVISENGYEGIVTSSSYSPSLKKSIGFVSINRNATNIWINIRGKKFALDVVKYPFIKSRKFVENII